jgi:hypothetical protein
MNAGGPEESRDDGADAVIEYRRSIPRSLNPVSGYIAFNSIVAGFGLLVWIVPLVFLSRRSPLGVVSDHVISGIWIVVTLASILGGICALGIVAHEWLILKQFDRWVLLTLLCGLVGLLPLMIAIFAAVVTLARG